MKRQVKGSGLGREFDPLDHLDVRLSFLRAVLYPKYVSIARKTRESTQVTMPHLDKVRSDGMPAHLGVEPFGNLLRVREQLDARLAAGHVGRLSSPLSDVFLERFAEDPARSGPARRLDDGYAAEFRAGREPGSGRTS